MKNLFFATILLSTAIIFTSCDPEDDMPHTHTTDYSYHAHIHAPNTDNKHVDDVLDIEVEFESHTGETVHHINVRIYNQDDNTEIYNQPTEGHIHATDGRYVFQDGLELSEDNGVIGHTNWVLEAKVWGHETGEGEVIETVAFHVHP